MIAFCLLVSGLCTACGSQGSAVSIATRPPTVVLSNPSPAQMELFVVVTMGGEDSTSRTQTSIDFHFTSKGRPVQFTGAEQFVCNGKSFSLQQSRPAELQIAGPTSILAGQAFRCTYRAGNTAAALLFRVPQASMIRSPQEHAHLPRNTHTLVTYQSQGEQVMGIVALTSTNKAVAQLNTPEGGQATLNTSSFSAGTGTIVLTETLTLPITQTGTSFALLQSRGNATTMVDVTWI